MSNRKQHLFQDEYEYLAGILTKLDEALAEAESNVERIDKEYMDEKRYMAQYRGEIDPHEMFQNELALRQIDRTGRFAVGVRDRLTRLMDSPYFARVDFREDGETEEMKCYVGRFSFSYHNELLICDWRSPVARLFYDCKIGKASYDSPCKAVEGELTGKRQFKIKSGKMEYVIETSDNIQDDVLQKELSQTSDEKMKSIISTIQKEQNRIIRNETAETMIIQGVAGSGKTSIALHRIAFLLYRFKERLSSLNVAIISPNKVFSDYISNVLPELGEEPIYETSFDDIARIQLEKIILFEGVSDPLEFHGEKWKERVRFKSTYAFVQLMDQYIQEMSKNIFISEEIIIEHFPVSMDYIQERLKAYSQLPFKQRLVMVAGDLYRRFESENIWGSQIPKEKLILKKLNAMLKIKSTLALYKDFYKQMGILEMFHMPAKKTLEWADVYPFLYLHAAFEGLHESKIIKHLVIDEMQDYTPIQFAVVNLLFRCQKTILGDFGQYINPDHQNTLEDLKKVYGEAEFMELNKSYRSTYEIICFAKHIRNVFNLEPVARHGDEPVIIQCRDGEDEIHWIRERIAAFLKSGNGSLGILTKTNSGADKLHRLLLPFAKVDLLSPESSRFANGITVASVQMSKGLEFDEVIIANVDSATYSTEHDRCLLYIGCTRAMHRLTLTYSGTRSVLLDGNRI